MLLSSNLVSRACFLHPAELPCTLRGSAQLAADRSQSLAGRPASSQQRLDEPELQSASLVGCIAGVAVAAVEASKQTRRQKRAARYVARRAVPSSSGLVAPPTLSFERVQLPPRQQAGKVAQPPPCGVMVYFPGLDGDGSYTINYQMEGLQDIFSEVWRFKAQPDDRSDFATVLAMVKGFLSTTLVDSENAAAGGVTLVGESFGGLLALHVALDHSTASLADGVPPLRGVVAINAATGGASLDIGKFLTDLPIPDAVIDVGMRAILPLGFLDPATIAGYAAEIIRKPTAAPSFIQQSLGLIDTIGGQTSRATIQFRLRSWLTAGQASFARQLKTKAAELRGLSGLISFVAGDADNVVPAVAEARRVAGLLPGARVRVVRGGGHALFFPYASTVDRERPTLKTLVREAQEARDEQSRAVPELARWRPERTASSNPPLIYFPGIAGEGLGTVDAQLDPLLDEFDCHRMLYAPLEPQGVSELPTFEVIVELAAEYCIEKGQGESWMLVGESFGGLVAFAVALRLQELGASCAGVCVANPATSYTDLPLAAAAPVALQNCGGSLLPTALTGILLGSSLDSWQWRRLLGLTLEDIDRPGEKMAEILAKLSEPPPGGSDSVRQAWLWRCEQWLLRGCEIVNSQVDTLKAPALLIAGADDNFLPSEAEVNRLADLIADSTQVILRGRGHAVLDGRTSLLALLRSWERGPLFGKRPIPYVTDFERPTTEMLQEAAESTDAFVAACAPAWLSSTTDGTGTAVAGLQGIEPLLCDPSRPALFVGFHQFFAMDVTPLIAKVYRDYGVVLRGLTHPQVFENPDTMQDYPSQIQNYVKSAFTGERPEVPPTVTRSSAILDDIGNNSFRRFGGVPVSPRNMYRLLDAGEKVLLFPGGVKESFHKRDESYSLQWPDEAEFVRPAARFGAPIIPFASVGADEFIQLALDQDELMSMPVFGDNLKSAWGEASRARSDEAAFVSPLGVPVPPERFYYLFGEPIETADVDPKNAEQCAAIYQQVKEQVDELLKRLKSGRRADPLRKAPERWRWQISNPGKNVPDPPVEPFSARQFRRKSA